MKTQLLILKTALLLFVLAACNEDETFHPLKIEATGIDLLQDESSEFQLLGEIGSETTEFTLQGSDEYSDFASVTRVTVDNVEYEVEPNPLYNDASTFKGDWGEITNSSATKPFKMYFNINANTSDKERVFNILIGYGYWYRNLRIVQAGVTLNLN